MHSPVAGGKSVPLIPITLATTNDPRTPLYQKTNQVLNAALAELGFALTVVTLPNKRSLSWANLGKVDGKLFRISNLDLAKLPNLEQVTEAIAIVDQSVIGKEHIIVNGWQSMQSYTIAYERGTVFLDKNQARFKGVILVDDFHQAIQLISMDRADITVTSHATANRLLNLSPVKFSDIKIHTPPLVKIKLHTYINKTRHPNLAKQLAQILHTMKQDGRYQQLNQIKSP
ncbi:hypothetical protein PSECIP111951_01354 [Pseudoalteromonas holothuriae]|uniref:Solute-binding protein family 3/N-terminal domain-containing protein n=1 Tax=Pseudoalteromonas holothuriae TaxID=2963714 RepID=A0ABN8UJ82_9GAMM|nr:transporter substrate-binding domain-containing protein [Pseudoalteromonas sp. CIP111951]CAH9055950.1 hypothetical protein PSECIP111951_01354 [Pseudoalteromonas sp. CIP111951]